MVCHSFYYIWFIGPSSVTERTSNDQRFRSLDDTVLIAKLSRVRNWPDWGPNYLVATWQVFLASTNSSAQETGDTVQWIVIFILSLSLSYHFPALLQRISNCSIIKTVLTPDKVLKVLIYGLLTLVKSNTLENAWNGRNMWTVNNGWIIISVKYGFITLLQRIFNCEKMQDTTITPDKVLNTLVYRPLNPEGLGSAANRFWCILAFNFHIWWQHFKWFCWITATWHSCCSQPCHVQETILKTHFLTQHFPPVSF